MVAAARARRRHQSAALNRRATQPPRAPLLRPHAGGAARRLCRVQCWPSMRSRKGGLPCRAMPSISTRNVLGRTAVRSILTGFLALALAFGLAGTADAGQKKKNRSRRPPAARNIIRLRLLRSGSAMQARSTRRSITRSTPGSCHSGPLPGGGRCSRSARQRAALVHLHYRARRDVGPGLNLAPVLTTSRLSKGNSTREPGKGET